MSAQRCGDFVLDGASLLCVQFLDIKSMVEHSKERSNGKICDLKN
jgi:hypothetical protein